MDASETTQFSPVATPQTSLWYVTNGRSVVGPVDTDLLLRGISMGRVPDDCYIAQPTWGQWRSLDQIREVRALYREREALKTDEVGRPLQEALLFAGIEDDDKLLKAALKLAVEQTHADVGVVHQDWPPHVGLITTHSYGRGMVHALGRIIPWWDPVREAAVKDQVMLSLSGTSDWSRVASMRLSTGGPVKAVAAVPVKVAKGHRTVIELGSFQHSFRTRDAQILSQLSGAVSRRLEQLAF